MVSPRRTNIVGTDSPRGTSLTSSKPEKLLTAFRYIYKKAIENPEMDEDELYDVLSDSDFFTTLGYLKVGKDIRKQKTIVESGKKPDFYCLDDFQNVVFVLEAKKPLDEHLEAAFDQLWRLYVIPLRSHYGVLINGKRVIVYSRKGDVEVKLLDRELDKITRAESDLIMSVLRKPEHEVMTLENLKGYLSATEKLSLQVPQAKQFFLETFALTPDSIYGELVKALMDLFDDILPKSKFLRGAWSFWLHSLARKPQSIPSAWKPFLGEKSSEEKLYPFMFCLETAQALLARLMLAKACQDYGFPNVNLYDFVLKRIPNMRGQIRSVSYPIVLSQLLKEMEGLLVTSVFEEDIFSWWTDPFQQFATRPGWALNDLEVSADVDSFSSVAASVFLVFYKYEFLNLPSDVLGDLYQAYFDRETRRALGEFYTPEEIGDYILQAVDYRGGETKRLVDPSCGSGTFLAKALKLYLAEQGKFVRGRAKTWREILRDLCTSPRIVGFDIHPFAVLMSQVRFMVEILPAYKLALDESQQDFRLPRLPVFRTDSLSMETKFGEQSQLRLMESETELTFTITLPVAYLTQEKVTLRVVLPSWKEPHFRGRDVFNNLDEYFRGAQALFDALKSEVRSKAHETSKSVLERYIVEYLPDKDYSRLASLYKTYADRLLKEVYTLQEEFEDGRLVKSIEDAVLSAILKNYFRYDYVVGNPPYVRVQTLSEESKRDYSRFYASAKGNYDLYVIFIERGLRWLTDSGVLGYICPNRFATVNYGLNLRSFIHRQFAVEQFIDFRDTGAFRDVLNYPAIVTFRRTEHPEALVKVALMLEETSDTAGLMHSLESSLDHIKSASDVNRTKYFEAFGFPSSSLRTEGWFFAPSDRRQVFEKMVTGKTPLSDFADTTKTNTALFEGLSTGAKEIFILRAKGDLGDRIIVYSDLDQQEYEVEKPLLRPYVEDPGKWYSLQQNEYLVFPYEVRATTFSLIQEEILRNKFPGAYAYLVKHKAELESRVGFKDSKEWYAYSAPRSLSNYEVPKFMVRGFAIKSQVSYDPDGRFYFGPDIYGLVLKDRYKDYAELLLGLLNSNLTNFFARVVGVVHGSGYYKFEDRFLKRFPVKVPTNSDESKIVDNIKSLVSEIVSLSKVAEGKSFPEAYLNAQTNEEFDTVKVTFRYPHADLRPIISSVAARGYILYPHEGEDQVWFESESKAKFILASLLHREAKEGTATFLVPREDRIARQILKEYEDSLAGKAGASIGQLEERLEQELFKLYGLTATDVRAINSLTG